LDEYNIISQDPTKTRVQVAYETWRDVLQSDAVWKHQEISIILFLNKVDLLTRKLVTPEDREEFGRIFPTYSGEGIESAAESIKKKFLDPVEKDFTVTSHVICALDTGLMEIIFKAIKTTIFDSRMNSVGMKL